MAQVPADHPPQFRLGDAGDAMLTLALIIVLVVIVPAHPGGRVATSAQ